MAARRQTLDLCFPPNCPIAGRGLPLDASIPIPTPQLRFARACGLFATSLLAAALLALGPAVVIAKIGARVPVVVLASAAERADAAEPAPAAVALCRGALARTPFVLRAEPMIVPAGTGAPRRRTSASAVAGVGFRAAEARGAARLAARRRRRGVRAPDPPTLERRQRPPPPGAAQQRVPPTVFAPATPPHVAWCAPVFLSPVT